MAHCLLCDKKGFFLKVTQNGLCHPCDKQVVTETVNMQSAINRCRKVVESSKEKQSVRLSCYDKLMDAVNHLLEFEKRGIPTITPKPSEFISHFTGKRDQLESLCDEPNEEPEQTTTGEKGLSEADAIKLLEELCNELTLVTPDKPPLSQSKIDKIRSRMDKAISETEKQFPKNNSQKLEQQLGSATLLFTRWFIRGDVRIQYFQRATKHLETAHLLSRGEENDAIACTLGELFIKEATIRNLEKGISYLKPVFDKAEFYEPNFCSYPEAYYKLGNYEKAIEYGLKLHHLAEKTKKHGNIMMERFKQRADIDLSPEEWEKESRAAFRYYTSSLPTVPMNTVAKSYRKMAKDCKKRGEIERAILLFEKLVNTGLATDNDKKILGKLQTLGQER